MTAATLQRLDRQGRFGIAAIGAALASLVAGIAINGWLAPGVTLAAAVVAAPFVYAVVGRWERFLAALCLVILFVPIRRYELPAALPFNLEPYRLAAALVIMAWIVALLIGTRVRLSRSAFDKRLAVIVLVVFASELANAGRFASLSSYAVKAITFFSSFVLVYYVIVSVVRTNRAIDVVVKTLVGGGAIVAFFAIVERRTKYNVFDHLHGMAPVLRFAGDSRIVRDGHFRAVASAEHPIALSALMVVLLPLAYYLIRCDRGRTWWIAGFLLVMGNLATASRTGILMLLVVGFVLVALRGGEFRRFWPALLPALLAIHIAVPGALGGVRAGFFPKGGLIAQQRGTELDVQTQNSRLSRIGPATQEFLQHPLFGVGYGTRVTGNPEFSNAGILDDQWLGTLLESGAAGVLAWAALMWSSVRRFGRAAKRDRTSRGTFLVAIAASVTAYAVGMFTYDAFSFVQVTFVFWIALALGAVVLADEALLARRGEPGAA